LGDKMRKRPGLVRVLSGLVVLPLAFVVGVAAVPGVSQATVPRAKKMPIYYVSLGDSYSVGFQPAAISPTDPTGGTSGYTAYVAHQEHLRLENFGCGGATTSSILDRTGCDDPAALHPVLYPTTTQQQAALAFIAAHPGQVGFITISIGGNDITGCTQSDPTAAAACLTSADSRITTNLISLVSSLNTALTSAGDTAKIVGLTYPDVILGAWVNPGGGAAQTLAAESVQAFDLLINPTLKSVYTSGVPNGIFVDVTNAPYREATSGSDTPLTSTQKTKQFGIIPDAVHEICQLTYFCSLQNIHANTRGYRFIGALIVAAIQPTRSALVG
jgi:lysophospholipase L1-like esterase